VEAFLDGGGQISPSAIDFHRRPYTLSHYRASVWFTVFLYFSFYYILVVNCVCQLFNNDQWRCWWWWWWHVFWHMRTNRHTDTLITVLRSNNSEPTLHLQQTCWPHFVPGLVYQCRRPVLDLHVPFCRPRSTRLYNAFTRHSPQLASHTRTVTVKSLTALTIQCSTRSRELWFQNSKRKMFYVRKKSS